MILAQKSSRSFLARSMGGEAKTVAGFLDAS